ncbi:MAG: hypothetical protein HQK96_06935 [Nitrospirae bacterium]|nr:hypothetical protein [Nitrospirota bacterium]
MPKKLSRKKPRKRSKKLKRGNSMDVEEKEDHPSYAQLSFHRVQSNARAPLYGTSNECREYIAMTVKSSQLNRSLHRHWYFGKETLIEVVMSPSQFAEAITSLNMGDGVPVTLTAVRKGPLERVERPKFKDERDILDKEFKKDVHDVMQNADEIVAKVQALAEQKTISKTAMKEVVELVMSLRQDINENIPFIAKSFNEFVNKSISSAKVELDAFVDHKIHDYGMEKLKDQAPRSVLLIDRKDEV